MADGRIAFFQASTTNTGAVIALCRAVEPRPDRRPGERCRSNPSHPAAELFQNDRNAQHAFLGHRREQNTIATEDTAGGQASTTLRTR